MSAQSRRSASRYRQFRLTATQRGSGLVDYSIYAKPLAAAWDEHQLLGRWTSDHPIEPIEYTEDVIALLVILLEERLLPR